MVQETDHSAESVSKTAKGDVIRLTNKKTGDLWFISSMICFECQKKVVAFVLSVLHLVETEVYVAEVVSVFCCVSGLFKRLPN